MVVFQGYQRDKKVPILITVEYDEETGEMIVEVTRGFDTATKTFTPAHEPKDGLMNIIDVEKSVKLANILIKELKRR